MFRSGPFFRDDTIFGVCEALGEDFGFRPNLLRALIGAGLLFSPVLTIAAYVAAAVLVLVSRWLVPDPIVTPGADDIGEVGANEDENEPLPLAA
jgi:phage shock protein C